MNVGRNFFKGELWIFPSVGKKEFSRMGQQWWNFILLTQNWEKTFFSNKLNTKISNFKNQGLAPPAAFFHLQPSSDTDGLNASHVPLRFSFDQRWLLTL